MTYGISEKTFLEGLTYGVQRTTKLIYGATEFHGDAVRTEYMLTADIAREFMERHLEVKVECLNRHLLNAITALKNTAKKRKKILGNKRTDVALVRSILPVGMVELKIGVRKLTGVKKDLTKIAKTMSLLKPQYAAKVIGAAVFQIHLATTRSRHKKQHFVSAMKKIENRLEADLRIYRRSQPDFTFTLHPLNAANEGFVEAEIERDEDGSLMVGRPGHVTRYYSILVRSTRPVPPLALDELRQLTA